MAAFLHGNDLHYLDHIAPLSGLLFVKLFVTEEHIVHLIEKFYPNIQVELLSNNAFPEYLLHNYDVLFTCLPKQLLDQLFFFDEYKLRKKLLFCWLPHGNSDKNNLGALIEEKIALVYGKQMIDTLNKENITANHITIGNFRQYFYEKNKQFYLNRCPIFKIQQKTIFYGPTWNDSNVKEHLLKIIECLPYNYNLYIKLHPNIAQGQLSLLLHAKIEGKTNIIFLDEIPTIYPIL